MKRIIKAAPLLLMFAASEARAGCDACIQASVEKASASISASLNSLKTTVDTNVQATNQLKVTVDTSNSTMVGLLNAQQQQMLTALDGVAAKLSLSQEKLGVTIRNLTDYTVNEINLAIKNQTKTEGFIEIFVSFFASEFCLTTFLQILAISLSRDRTPASLVKYLIKSLIVDFGIDSSFSFKPLFFFCLLIRYFSAILTFSSSV